MNGESIMPQEHILFAQHNDTCFFKLRGELRHTNATAMDDLIDRLFRQGQLHCAQVVIDLNEATFMDSTHIGLLASIARHCKAQDLPAPTLFSTHLEINDQLVSLRLDEVFELITQPTDQAVDFSAVTSSEHSEDKKARMILRAHEALVELNDANRTAFEPVVELLRAQLKNTTP
ncbi:STAS domain-containing protein [Salinispirillum sp. LH 10-3-1]|uniref:STAS domain-containing protein n=1 Tax=Salinispirillum sp. LH 10-3-1 TaxID=2952525 RepID=A0AB38YJG0_9GAMM